MCIALVVRGNFTEALVLIVLAFVVTANHSDLERRMAFGVRASLPKPESQLFTELDETDTRHITGNYILNLIFYIGWAIFALFAAKSIAAGILLWIQSKLIVEQHRESPNRYVVGASHTLPALVFFMLVPGEMSTVKISSAVATFLLLLQSFTAIKILNDSDKLVQRARRGQ